MAAILAGAVIGGVAGYVFWTDEGRRIRRRHIEPALDDLARELSSLRSTVQKTLGVASEGWKLLNEALGDINAAPPGPGGHTSPF